MTRLYVGNLPFTANEESLRSMFAAHGTVEKLSLIVDRISGVSRGFGFVEMSAPDANRAMQALNGHAFGGRQMKVREPQHAASRAADLLTDTGARLVPGPMRRQMLRISFRSLSGDAPTLVLASCLRFCSDGTLRGADHCVVARSVEGCWKVGGKLHRELDCDGPVRIRLLSAGGVTANIGPFRQLRTKAGVLYGDEKCLNIALPHPSDTGDCAQLTLIWDGGKDGQD